MKITMKKSRIKTIVTEEVDRFLTEMYQHSMVCVGKQIKVTPLEPNAMSFPAKVLRIIRPSNNQYLEQVPLEDYEQYDYIIKNLTSGENMTISGFANSFELSEVATYGMY